MRVLRETEALMNNYVRKRNNRSRRDTRAHAINFANFLVSSGVKSLGQAGKRHVIQYWIANQHLEDGSLKNHYYAIKKLLELYGSGFTPPMPRYRNECPKNRMSM